MQGRADEYFDSLGSLQEDIPQGLKPRLFG
jgi:hypothetical protein